jgi:hypothetical protein
LLSPFAAAFETSPRSSPLSPGLWDSPSNAIYCCAARRYIVVGFNELECGKREKYVSDIQNHLHSLETSAGQVDNLVGEGVHNPQFPQQREKLITSFDNVASQSPVQLAQVDSDLRLREIELLVAQREGLKEADRRAKGYIGELEKQVEEGRKVLDNLKSQVMETGVSVSSETFQRLRNQHKDREKRWFVAFILSGGLTLAAVIGVLLTSLDAGSLSSVLPGLFKRLLLITTPALAMRVTLGKYNLERNLRIVYDHRNTVLDQYRVFENAISDDDLDSKNRLRLEVVKFVFSDPATGYLEEPGGRDLSVSPVVNLIEQMGRSGS